MAVTDGATAPQAPNRPLKILYGLFFVVVVPSFLVLFSATAEIHVTLSAFPIPGAPA